MQGSFVYAHYASPTARESSGLFAWSVSSFQSAALESSSQLEGEGESYVSPDGKFVARSSGRDLVLLSRDGTRSFPMPNDGLVIRAYLPDGRILLDTEPLQSRIDNFQIGAGLTDLYYIFDPTTGETTKSSVFLPHFEPDLTWNIWTLQYSPDMKYVLYRSTSDGDKLKFTLFDLEKNEIVWVGPSRDASLSNAAWTVPGWQPDSSALTAEYVDESTGNNYYSISPNGTVSPLTSFIGATLVPTASTPWWSDREEFASWSPNERYLVSEGSLQGESLNSFMYIWDSQDQVLYKPCLPNEQNRMFPYRTIWSFDGFHFLTTLTFELPPLQTDAPSPGYVSTTYILDLANRIVFELPDYDSKNSGELTPLYKGGVNLFLGWVNWQIP